MKGHVTRNVMPVLDQIVTTVLTVYQTLMKTLRDTVYVKHGIAHPIKIITAPGREKNVQSGQENVPLDVQPVPLDTSQNNVRLVFQMPTGTKTVYVNATPTGLATIVTNTLENVTHAVMDVMHQAMRLVTRVHITLLVIPPVFVNLTGLDLTAHCGRDHAVKSVTDAMTRTPCIKPVRTLFPRLTVFTV
jgi:hypothetical protein